MENPKETMGDATMIQEGYELEPRQQYGLGSFVRSITKPISKLADKAIPNEIGQFLNKIPAPLRTAAMFIPGVGPYMAVANAAATLSRSQGRGLSLGDIAKVAS